MRSGILAAAFALAFAFALAAAGCSAGEPPAAMPERAAQPPGAPAANDLPEARVEAGPDVASALASPSHVEASPPTAPDATCDAESVRERTPVRALAAVAKGRTPAFGRPGGERLHVFEKRNVNDVPTVFGVLGAVLGPDCEPDWYRVQLPVRPNGLVGWVRAADVTVAAVRTRIEVDLSERRLDFYRDGEHVLRAPVAIGADITPTPTGSYYVNQRLLAPDPWGPFGPGAIGISAFSPVLQDWAQGGPIAIHGTNDPGSIGEAVSHGCIRLANETLTYLFDQVLAGTPVEILA